MDFKYFLLHLWLLSYLFWPKWGVEKFQWQRWWRYHLTKMEVWTEVWKNILCRGSLSHAPQTTLRVSKESLIIFFESPLYSTLEQIVHTKNNVHTWHPVLILQAFSSPCYIITFFWLRWMKSIYCLAYLYTRKQCANN